ncbi:MAG: N-acetyltransferase [Bacteroidota bacterium]
MITDFEKTEIKDIIHISDRFIGENFQTFHSVENYLKNKKNILKVYRVNNKIVGFIKGKVIKSNLLQDTLLKTNQIIIDDLSCNEYVGYFETICVKETFRRKKIATDLLLDLIASLKKIEPINIVYSTVWKTSDGTNAKKLVENIDFKIVSEIPDYWHDDSIAKNYKCPKCNLPPCKCSMLFYKLEII